MRAVGDLTLNHSAKGHEWFANERDLYYFDESVPDGYVSWLGIGSLPKLNWGSAVLRERMQVVAKRWLDVGLDGWRIDVANMTGRRRDSDLGREAARAIRSVLGPDHLLIAEHGHDFRGDLAGGRRGSGYAATTFQRSCGAASGAYPSGCRDSAGRQ